MGHVAIAANAVHYDLALRSGRDQARLRRRARLRGVVLVATIVVSAATGYFMVRDLGVPLNFRELVKANPLDAGLWGQAAAGYNAQGDARAASGSYGVARLLDADATAWRDRPLDDIPHAVTTTGITDDTWVGRLATRAEQASAFAVAHELFAIAQKLNNSNPEWGQGTERMQIFQRLRSQLSSADQWGTLALALERWKDAAAEGAFAVARLLNPQDQRWAKRNPQLLKAPAVITRLAIRDTAWLQQLGSTATRLKAFDAAEGIYGLAALIQPDNRLWPALAAEAKLLGRFSTSSQDDEFWGELGNAYAAQGSAKARSAYAVAHLIDPNDPKWRQKAPNSRGDEAIPILRDLGVRDDAWIGSLAVAARTRGEIATARPLYEFARTLNPKDQRWLRGLREPGVEDPVEPVEEITGPPPTEPTVPLGGGPDGGLVAGPDGKPAGGIEGRGGIPVAPPPPPPVPTTLTLRAPYPIVVTNGDRVRPASQTHELRLSPGPQTVLVTAPQVYLRRNIQLNASSGGSRVEELPQAVSIRVAAFPGNCRVAINGFYAGDLPQTFPVVKGENTFDFEWTTLGRKRSLVVNVSADGQQVFATAPQ